MTGSTRALAFVITGLILVLFALSVLDRSELPREQPLVRPLIVSPEVSRLPDEQGEANRERNAPHGGSGVHQPSQETDNITLADRRKQLEDSLEETVLGVIDPAAIFNQALAILGDEVGKADLEYEDETATAFPITMPTGMSSHLLVDHDKFERGGHELREYSVRLQIAPQKTPWLSNGAVRHGYSVYIGASRDADGKAWRYSLMTCSKVALHESQELGIDAYHGRFAEGIYYIYYPDGILPTYCRTLGVVDGHYDGKEFDPRLPTIIGEPGKELLEAWNQKVSQLVEKTK